MSCAPLARAKASPNRKSRFPCIRWTCVPPRAHSASAPITRALSGSSTSSSPAQYSNRSPSMYRACAPRAGTRRNSKKTRLISGRDAHRCRSEMKRTGNGSLNHFHVLDDHVLYGHVGVTAAFSGLDPFDFVDDVPAFDDLAEHAVAPALGAGRRVIQEVVVLDVDEELARGRMRLGSPRHGDGIAIVLEAVAGLVLDGSSSRLLAHSRLEAAALDHEAVDDAVKHGIGIEPRLDVSEEILDRFRRALGIELERDDAEVCSKLDHGSRYLAGFSDTDSIKTGRCGTFWCCSTVVVGALEIRSTVSIPSTTRPNTAYPNPRGDSGTRCLDTWSRGWIPCCEFPRRRQRRSSSTKTSRSDLS